MKDLRAAGCKQTKATRTRAEMEAGQGAVLVTEVGRESTRMWAVTKGWGCPKTIEWPGRAGVELGSPRCPKASPKGV